jgi:hypothetical protein
MAIRRGEQLLQSLRDGRQLFITAFASTTEEFGKKDKSFA